MPRTQCKHLRSVLRTFKIMKNQGFPKIHQKSSKILVFSSILDGTMDPGWSLEDAAREAGVTARAVEAGQGVARGALWARGSPGDH